MKTSPNHRKAEKEARRILTSYGFFENPAETPFEDLLFAEGVFLRTRKIEGALGQMIRIGPNDGIITISDQIDYLPQKRFVIAHELGHWILHRAIKEIFACDTAKFQAWHRNSSPYELEANAFAAELLMPGEKIRTLCNENPLSAHLIRTIANSFKTSLTATCLRLTKYGSHPLIVVFSKDSTVRWSFSSDDFSFGLYDNNFPVPARTWTHALYHKDETTISPEPYEIRAIDWFDKDRSVREDQYLYEVVIPLPSIHAAITILWEHELNFSSEW